MYSSLDSYPPGYLEVDHGGNVIGAASFILVFTTILLVLRLYARTLTKASWGWDEFLLAPSYLCLIGLLICLYRQSTVPWSQSQYNIPNYNIIEQFR